MTATVEIREANGVAAAMTFTALTSARYSTSDSATPGTNNPIPIPTSNFNYSYWKHQGLYMHGAFTQIDNIRWYTDGDIGWNYGTSGALYVGLCSGTDKGVWTSNNIAPLTQYMQASGTVGTTGTSITASGGHGQASGWAKASDYTVGSPLQVDSTTHTTSGDISKLLVTQVAIDDDATQGTQTAETVTMRYDEI